MARPHPREVERWIDDMEDESLNIKIWGLSLAYHLPKIPLDSAFLEAASCFWDPDVHVFRFGDNELCPTLEEFSAILGIPHDNVVIPTFQPNLKKMLQEMCHIPPREINNYIRGEELDTRALYQKFHALDEDTPRDTRRVAFGLCLLDQYFLTSKEAPDAIMVEVLLQTTQGRNPASVILAETFMALDEFHHGRTTALKGCPHILMLWLEEKLSLLTVPIHNPYRPSHVLQRHPVLPLKNLASWVRWFNGVNHHIIRWTSPWWGIESMTTRNNGTKGVLISGMRQVTTYFPYRIKRQFGEVQEDDYRKGLSSTTFKATAQTVAEQEERWGSRCMLRVRKEPRQPFLDEEYRRWLHEDIAIRNEEKKKKEQEERRQRALDEIRRNMRKPPLHPPPTRSMS